MSKYTEDDESCLIDEGVREGVLEGEEEEGSYLQSSREESLSFICQGIRKVEKCHDKAYLLKNDHEPPISEVLQKLDKEMVRLLKCGQDIFRDYRAKQDEIENKITADKVNRCEQMHTALKRNDMENIARMKGICDNFREIKESQNGFDMHFQNKFDQIYHFGQSSHWLRYGYRIQMQRGTWDKMLFIKKNKDDFCRKEMEKMLFKESMLTKGSRELFEVLGEDLQYEMEKAKQEILMSFETAEYNLDILKARSPENVFILGQLSNRYQRMFVRNEKLRRKIKNIHDRKRIVFPKYQKSIYHLHLNISSLESNNNVFVVATIDKFKAIWDVTLMEMVAFGQNVFDVDRLLHVQVLFMKWESPATFDTISISKELQRVSAPFTKHQKPKQELKSKKRLLRNINRFFVNVSGELDDMKLGWLLNLYGGTEKQLVRLERLFEVLAIVDEHDINILSKTLQPYFWCNKCFTGPIKESITKAHGNRASLNFDFIACQEQKAKKKPCKEKEVEYLLFLGLVASKRHQGLQAEKEQKTVKLSITKDSFSNEAIKKYWEQFFNCLPTQKRILWKFLEEGLKRKTPFSRNGKNFTLNVHVYEGKMPNYVFYSKMLTINRFPSYLFL